MIGKHMPNFRWRHLAGVISVLALQALLIPKTATAANRALLVGIDDYRVSTISAWLKATLPACESP